MNFQHRSQAFTPGRLAAVRLRELAEFVEKKVADPSTKGPNGQVDIIAQSLLGKAPDDFLRRTSTVTLRQISEECRRALEALVANDLPYSVHVYNPATSDERADSTCLVLCSTDRPFIVDSISEHLRAQGLVHQVLLHPVLRLEDQLLSLTYIELDSAVPTESLDSLKRDLEQTFLDITLVTDHFPQMKDQLLAALDELSSVPIDSALVSGAHSTREITDLLTWLLQDGFVFTGCCEWEIRADAAPQIKSPLGLFVSQNPVYNELAQQCLNDVTTLQRERLGFSYSKILSRSTVHRRVYLDLVCVAIPSDSNRGPRIVGFLGMHTSRAVSQDVTTIPVLRKKLRTVVDQEDLAPNSYDYKEAMAIFNAFPRSTLFRIENEALRAELRLMMSIQRRSETRVSLREHSQGRFVSVAVIMPASRLSATVDTQIENYLAHSFGVNPRQIDKKIAVVESHLVASFYLIPNLRGTVTEIPVEQFEHEISNLTLTWEDKLYALLDADQCEILVTPHVERVIDALPDDYRALHDPKAALRDLDVLLRLTDEQPMAVRLFRSDETSDLGTLFDLRIYKRGGDLTLSSILPVLENVGFDIAHESIFPFAPAKSTNCSVTSLLVRPRYTTTLSDEALTGELTRGLEHVFTGVAENDSLNALLIAPGLTLRDIAIIRTYAHYLWQIRIAPSESLITMALITHPKAAAHLIELFSIKFNPDRFSDNLAERDREFSRCRTAYLDELQSVTALAHDRALRAFLNAIESTLRTNAFQTAGSFRIAIKIDCKAVTALPKPRPQFEIFVSAPEVEGVHLRGGKVARGGIRWSERPEDFRTEVLGLMKTQMVKNSIIVPVGAKGGFVVKPRPGKDKITQEDVTACYQIFIRSLLELSDNRIGERVVHPPRTLIYDGEDPYFVVAADKGTASFSDVANALSHEFELWIGDGFASGGSRGYNHKKYGITARGAWEAACVHFREMGLAVENSSFTVVGIGDMSGDVFGNGLIISPHVKLLAAFDHRHIFVDPDPGPAVSFAERKRLFDLPRSSWADYNAQLISPGGGIFPRDAKTIVVTPEMRRALSIDGPESAAETISGQELVQAILRARVDLLWNGGIGTYFKASNQDHTHAADRANDGVRIDAREIRARSVAEGGNLGFTQAGRIEYALRGGHINTDAIDNSGGVDLSDHEVNLKILLSAPVQRGELAEPDRVALLFQCADEVCDSVIERNRAQSTALSLIVEKSPARVRHTINYLRKLERESFIDRRGEGLPDDETLARRAQDRIGITRPEAAVLLSYSKMRCYQLLLNCSLPDDPYLEGYLLRYFPAAVGERFSADIARHPLRREIISTQIANILCERMDPTFLFRLSEELGAANSAIVWAFLAAYEILGARELVAELEKIENGTNILEVHRALHTLSGALYGMTRWLLLHREKSEPLAKVVGDYQTDHQQLSASTFEILPHSAQPTFERQVRQAVAAQFPMALAERIANLPYATAVLEVIDLATHHRIQSSMVAKLFAAISSELSLGMVLEKANLLDLSDAVDVQAWRSLVSELRGSLGNIVRSLIHEHRTADPAVISEFLNKRAEVIDLYRKQIAEFEQRPFTLGALLVVTQRLRAIAEDQKQR